MDTTGIEFVTLEDGMMFLMQPVMAGMIKFTDLLTPGVRLEHIALMNDALLARSVNEQLIAKHNATNGTH